MRLRGCLFLFVLGLPLLSVAAAPGTLQGVKTSTDAQGVTFLLRVPGPVKFSPSQAGPRLWLLDLTGVSADTAAESQPVQSPLVSSYRLFSYHGANNEPHLGMEITLKDEAEVQAKQVPEGVQIRVRRSAANSAAKQQNTETAEATTPTPAVPVTAKPAAETPAAKTAAAPAGPAARSASAASVSPDQKVSALREVTVVQPQGKGALEVEILGEGQLQYQTRRLKNPDRLVLDLSNTRNYIRKNNLAVNTAPLKSVRIGQFRKAPPVTRVVMDLSGQVAFQVRHDEKGLVVSLSPAAASKPVAQSPASPEATDSHSEAGATVPEKAISAVAALKTGPALSANAEKSEAKRPPLPASAPEPVLLASNSTPVESSPSAATPSVQTPASELSAPSGASKPAPEPSPEMVNGIPVPATEKPSPGSLQAQPADLASAPASSMTPEPVRPPVVAANFSSAPRPSSATTRPVQQPAAAIQEKAARQPVLLAQQGTTPGAPVPVLPQAPVACISGAYTGEPISLNLKDVDLKDFFRLMHEVSGLNVVLDPNVSGSVTIVLDEVPWDQAMDIVDRNDSLDCTRLGNVIRIAKVSTLEAEAKAQLAKAQAEAQAQSQGMPLETETRTLSYAKAVDMLATLKTFLSPRGNVVTDTRTNMLIVTDIRSSLDNINHLIDTMDRRTQQVEIEARIVSASRSFARDIGSQLAASGLSGNVVLGGTGLVGTSPINRGTVPPLFIGSPPASSSTFAALPQPLAVNLPAVGATSGFTFLITAGQRFALDSIITAAEQRGIGKILSRPKIITQNNIQATVQQGVKIPIQTSINNTITVQYVNVVLRLTVTPQITSDGTIFLNLDIENTTVDAGIPRILGIPALDTQAATTNVLVSDGGTVFFGGIIQTNNQLTQQEVPLLGDIPLIGELFKRKATTSSTDELLFFITPKITQS